MKQKNLIALAAVTALFVVAAVMASKKSGASAAPATLASGPLVEGLTERINDVARLEVTNGGKTVTIEKAGADWVIQNASGFPAKFDTVKKSLLALADLQLAEAKTNDPERYAEIGVQDPTEEGASSTLVVIKDVGGAVLASLVLGDSKPGRSPELYARKTDEARAWRVKGRVDLGSDPKEWMELEVANVASDRAKQVTVTHSDGERLHVYKENPSDTNFLVEGVPADRELLSPTIANSLGSVLSYLTLDEVRPVAEVDFETTPLSTTEIRTWDGLVVMARIAELDGVKWVNFGAHYEAPTLPVEEPKTSEGGDEGLEALETDAVTKPDGAAVQAEALELNADLSPWAFRFPSYKQSNLEKRLGDLLRPPMPAPAEDGDVLEDEPEAEMEPGVVHDESDADSHDQDDSHDHSEDGTESDG